MTKRRKMIFHNGEPLVCIECNKVCTGKEHEDWERLPNGGFIHTGGNDRNCWRSYLKSLKEIIWKTDKKQGQQRLF